MSLLRPDCCAAPRLRPVTEVDQRPPGPPFIPPFHLLERCAACGARWYHFEDERMGFDDRGDTIIDAYARLTDEEAAEWAAHIAAGDPEWIRRRRG